MNQQTAKILSAKAGRLIAIFVLGLSLAACGKNDSSAGSAPAPTAKVDACALVTASMVARYATGLGKGHAGKVPRQSPVSTCVWSDADHLPALILTVAPSDPSGVAKGLEQGMAAMGYKVVSISGLGDEAAVAIQQADPKLHTKTGIATLAVRVGKRQIGYSPMRPPISGTGTPTFKRLKELAAKTAERLRERH
jgi:hypothetical protein